MFSLQMRVRCGIGAIVALLAQTSCSDPTADETSLENVQQTYGELRESAPGFIPARDAIMSGARPPLTQVGPQTWRAEDEKFVFFQRLDTGLTVLGAAGSYRDNLTPYGSSSAEHNAWTQRYLIERGLPEDQIDSVQGGADVMLVGKTSDLKHGLRPQPSLVGYYTVISRRVEGIRLPNSKIIASFAIDGTPISLHIDWPEVPRDVLTAAQDLPSIPSQNAGESVPEAVILHAPGYEEGQFLMGPTALYESIGKDGVQIYRDSSRNLVRPAFATEIRQ